VQHLGIDFRADVVAAADVAQAQDGAGKEVMLSGYCACINPANHQKIVSGENDGDSPTP